MENKDILPLKHLLYALRITVLLSFPPPDVYMREIKSSLLIYLYISKALPLP